MHLQDLDAQLAPKTYVVSNYFTAADVVLYGALHPILVRDTSIIRRYLDLLTPVCRHNCSLRNTTRTLQSRATSTIYKAALSCGNPPSLSHPRFP